MKFPKVNQTRVFKFTTILFACLFATTIIVQASTPSTTFTISSGVYPGAPSYTIYTVGGVYYAKDQNGYTEFSSTNASYVINTCITTIVATTQKTGTIQLKPGIIIDSPILLQGRIVLDGGGMSDNSLVYTGNDYAIKILASNAYNGATLQNIGINTTQNAAGGVLLYASCKNKIENLRVDLLITSTGNAICIDAGNNGSYLNHITDFKTRYGTYGVLLTTTGSAHTIANTIENGEIGGNLIGVYLKSPSGIGNECDQNIFNALDVGYSDSISGSIAVKVETTYNDFYSIRTEGVDYAHWVFTTNASTNRVFGGMSVFPSITYLVDNGNFTSFNSHVNIYTAKVLHGYLNAAQTLNTSDQIINFDTLDENHLSGFNLATHAFTVPFSGIYRIDLQVTANPYNYDNALDISIKLGSTIISSSSAHWGGSVSMGVTAIASTIITLTEVDVITFVGKTTQTPTALDLLTGVYTTFSIQCIS